VPPSDAFLDPAIDDEADTVGQPSYRSSTGRKTTAEGIYGPMLSLVASIGRLQPTGWAVDQLIRKSGMVLARVAREEHFERGQ